MGGPAVISTKQPGEAGDESNGEDDGDVEVAATGHDGDEEDGSRGDEGEESFHGREN